MAYTITKSDGTTLPTIPDGTIDTSSTNLALPGPNFVGYGQYLNQNLVHLLENFSSTSTPSGTNLLGQLWFDKGHQRLNVFTVNGFVPVSGITNSGTQPVITNDGEFWFDTFNSQFYVSNNGTWNLIGPQYNKSQGVSGAIPVVVGDGVTSGINHNVIQLQYGSSIIATISNDPTFTPKNYDPGFPKIYSGITINGNINASQMQPAPPVSTISTDTLDVEYINVSSGLNPTSNNSINLGSPTNRWATVYGTSSSSLYADLAENYLADSEYGPGTVLMFGGKNEVTVAEEGTTALAGVVSTNPAYLMNSNLEGSGVVSIALIGRVPCKVVCPVNKGDLLISAGSGLAKPATNPTIGQVIGRSLETVTETTCKTVEIVVGRIG
jgi:hypothetical protein